MSLFFEAGLIVSVSLLIFLLLRHVVRLLSRVSAGDRSKTFFRACKILSSGSMVYYIAPHTKAVTWLRRAGYSQEWSLVIFKAGVELAAWVIILSAFVLYAHGYSGLGVLGFLFIGFAMLFFCPRAYLQRKEAGRVRAAEIDLPFVLDLVRLRALAGQSIDRALVSIQGSVHGLWRQAIQDIQLRRQRGESFERSLKASVVGVSPGVLRAVSAIERAKVLGVPLGETLAIESSLLRHSRRQAQAARARRASVLIALPLVLCIFPSLLIIYLAPALLRLAGDI